ncbi:MAG: two-component regulator propeller domain-containing protein [Verrucomicrobiota bacterium]
MNGFTLPSLACVVLAAAVFTATATATAEGVTAESASGARREAVDTLFRNWTTRDGLPHNRVRAVMRSRDGFVWLGTDAGLARFDGVHFLTWGLREGLGAAAVFSLSETEEGTLWIGTQGGGLSALRDGRIVRTWTSADGLPSDTVDHLMPDREGGLWVSAGGTLRRMQDGRVQALKPGETAPESLYCWGRDSFGTLWGTFARQGLLRVENGRWIQPPGVPAKARGLAEDPAGGLWLTDEEGHLWRGDPEKGAGEATGGMVWRLLPEAGILPQTLSSMTVAADGTLWVAVFRQGVTGWKDGRWRVPVPCGSYTPDLAESVFAFPDGPVWVISAEGLFALTPLPFSIGRVNNSTGMRASNDLGGLLEESPGTFLLASQGGGFLRWRDGVATRLNTNPALSRPVYGNFAWKAPDGTSWLAGGAGVFGFRDGVESARPVFPGRRRDVWSLCGNPAGGLWAGTGDGTLLELRPGENHLTPVDYGGGREGIKALYQEENGTLWVGTRGGGLHRRSPEGKWRKFGPADGLPSRVIRFITPAGPENLWIGTAGSGLVLLRQGRFTALTSREGLPDDTVSQLVLADSGRLWLGTNRGLAVFSAAESARMAQGDFHGLRPLILNLSDGLPSEEFTIVPPVKTAGGGLVFATTRGFVRLDPGGFQADQVRPCAFLETILANGRPVRAEGGKLVLPPGVERLEFGFTALHFAAPERLAFRSRLSGLEADWSAASPQRQAEYRNLSPGNYRFEVSATTGNGLWSAEAAGLDITLRPHFWQTWWFRAAGGLILLAGLILAVRARERRRTRRRIEALEQEQAVQSERARIARDLHDDVGASLTQVALLSELARGDLATDPARADGTIREIFTTAREVTRSLDEIVWAVNPGQDTVSGFMTYLATSAQSFCRTAGLAVRLDFPENPPARPLSSPVRHHLCLAAREALHNAVKHSGATGVRLRLSLVHRRLDLSVEDNGQGIPPAEAGAPEGDGLLNLQNRMRQIGGTCAVSTPGGGGTRVEFTVFLGD